LTSATLSRTPPLIAPVFYESPIAGRRPMLCAKGAKAVVLGAAGNYEQIQELFQNH
jgi:hypothetical protein